MKNSTPYFSIIILAYEVEKYIKECIESVLSQTFTDFEMILVLPAGNDNTEQICTRYAKHCEKIRILKTENKGQLLNRISGYSIAEGEFLISLDGDDIWKKDLLETIYGEIQKYGCDLILFNFVRFKGKLMGEKAISAFSDEALFSKERKKLILQEFIKDNNINALWLKAFSKSILGKIEENFEEFASIRKAEDALYSFYIFRAAERILYLDRALYCYRMRDDSVTHSFRAEELRDIILVRRKLLEELKGERGIYDGLFYEATLKSFVDWLYHCALSGFSYEKKKILYQSLKKEPLYQKAWHYRKQIKIPKRLYIFLILHHVSFSALESYSRIYIIMKKFRKVQKNKL